MRGKAAASAGVRGTEDVMFKLVLEREVGCRQGRASVVEEFV